jgi:hypothetical protein
VVESNKTEETTNEVFASIQVEEENFSFRLHHHHRQEDTGIVPEESAPPPSPPTTPSRTGDKSEEVAVRAERLTTPPLTPRSSLPGPRATSSKRIAVTVSKNTHAESKKIDVKKKNKHGETRLSSPTLTLTTSRTPSTTTEPGRPLCWPSTAPPLTPTTAPPRR